jgi:hypothetical protein
MTMRKHFGLFVQALRLFGETLFKGCDVCETASLQGAAPFLRRRERVMAFSSPIKAVGHAVMVFVNTCGKPGSEQN